MDIYTFVRLDAQRSAFDRVGGALNDGTHQDRDEDQDDGPGPAPDQV